MSRALRAGRRPGSWHDSAVWRECVSYPPLYSALFIGCCYWAEIPTPPPPLWMNNLLKLNSNLSRVAVEQGVCLSPCAYTCNTAVLSAMSIEPCMREYYSIMQRICTENSQTRLCVPQNEQGTGILSSPSLRLCAQSRQWLAAESRGPESGWPLHLAAVGRAACDLSVPVSALFKEFLLRTPVVWLQQCGFFLSFLCN